MLRNDDITVSSISDPWTTKVGDLLDRHRFHGGEVYVVPMDYTGDQRFQEGILTANINRNV